MRRAASGGALARRRRAPTGSDQSHEDGANREVSWNEQESALQTKIRVELDQPGFWG